MHTLFPRLRRLAGHGGFSHFILPALTVLAIAGIGGYLVAQSHAATAANVEICDNNGSSRSVDNRGAYCLDDLNSGSGAAIWTAKTSGATGCFTTINLELVKNVKPFNTKVGTLTNFYAQDEVVYLRSCGPNAGYLHPEAEGDTQVMLNSIAGKAEE